jgi:hypothetical protein
MKLKIHLTGEGAAKLAEGDDPWSWYFSVETPHYNGAGENSLFLAELEVNLPDDKALRQLAIAVLQAKRQQILAEAQVKADAVAGRIQNLLCLTHTPEVQSPADDSQAWRESSTCIITGCGLDLGTAGQYWGDLWLHRPTQDYVFNASGGESGINKLLPEDIFAPDDRIIYADPAAVIQSGAVFNFPADAAELNDAAKQYLGTDSPF